MIKALLNAQTYIKIISESFQTTRSNALQFYPVNVYDYYLNLVKSIGPLLRGVLAEEAGELNVVPQNWSFRRHASGSDGSSGGNNPEPENDDNTSLPDMLSTTRQFQSKKGPGDVSLGRPTEEEQASPRFQNYETLRLLLHPMIPTTFPLFQTLGKALIPRREREPRDPYLRPRHLEIARALADTVLGQLRSSVATPQPTSKDFHFWIIMLHTITEMLIDHSSNRPHDRSGAHIIMPVLLAFKEEGGMDVLNSMLKVFTQAIRQRTETPPDESSKAKVAAFGLKKILDLYLTLVDDKYLSESSNHFALQPRTGDRSQNTPHLDQQLVVEFRAAILPEITDLWDSNFAEKVPHQTVSRLLDILKIISAAENEAQSTTRDKPPFQLFKYTDVRFDWSARRATVDDLVSKGHSPELVHEAVYRALGNSGSAREYCTAHTNGLAGPRNPIPPKDSDTSVLQEAPKEGEPSNVAGAPEPDRMSLDDDDEPPGLESPDLSGRSLGDDLGEIIDLPQATEDVREAPTTAAETPLQQSGSPATVPGAAAGDHGTEGHPVATKEDIDKCRAKLRGSMIDRCLDVIRAHPETAIEVSDLIRTMALRQQPNDTQDDVGPTLTSALSSLALDEEEEKRRNGKCIAAYAHLLALLLQDERFFESNIESLREGIDEYVGFLKMPPSTSGEEMPQWIPYILLVIEILLCHDERPVAAQWKAPKSLDEAVAEPIIQMRTPLIDDEQRAHILESLLEMLPRVGKEETLAVAALRVLVILTRNRRLAKLVGDKKNLQRLFLMAKQLSGSGSERFKQTKLTAHIMTILRHIVEDEETIKQIMRAEIKASFPTIQRTQRSHSDLTNYLRGMAPIALRAPDLFVDVTNEMLRFGRWASSSAESARSQALVLKENGSEQNADTTDGRSQPTEDATAQDIKQSTEPIDKEMTDAPKAHHESKRPVVENPDGVIHFLLCELLNYREVDDKEVPVVDKDQKSEATSGPVSEEKGFLFKGDSCSRRKGQEAAKARFQG
ncbi:hypothetical protein CEP52_009751 [Fusarium oligoseptatum]|uniref:Uncharacterized protein n=1 Tax=Fusarium oligoseptatum TaxID=2604345 RepID=A0A428TBK6_9HYPO|nr:hypothetical protein CEP52_009751 [Fusarium oligoseptatum]